MSKSNLMSKVFSEMDQNLKSSDIKQIFKKASDETDKEDARSQEIQVIAKNLLAISEVLEQYNLTSLSTRVAIAVDNMVNEALSKQAKYCEKCKGIDCKCEKENCVECGQKECKCDSAKSDDFPVFDQSKSDDLDIEKLFEELDTDEDRVLPGPKDHLYKNRKGQVGYRDMDGKPIPFEINNGPVLECPKCNNLCHGKDMSNDGCIHCSDHAESDDFPVFDQSKSDDDEDFDASKYINKLRMLNSFKRESAFDTSYVQIYRYNNFTFEVSCVAQSTEDSWEYSVYKTDFSGNKKKKSMPLYECVKKSNKEHFNVAVEFLEKKQNDDDYDIFESIKSDKAESDDFPVFDQNDISLKDTLDPEFRMSEEDALRPMEEHLDELDQDVAEKGMLGYLKQLENDKLEVSDTCPKCEGKGYLKYEVDYCPYQICDGSGYTSDGGWCDCAHSGKYVSKTCECKKHNKKDYKLDLSRYLEKLDKNEVRFKDLVRKDDKLKFLDEVEQEEEQDEQIRLLEEELEELEADPAYQEFERSKPKGSFFPKKKDRNDVGDASSLSQAYLLGYKDKKRGNESKVDQNTLKWKVKQEFVSKEEEDIKAIEYLLGYEQSSDEDSDLGMSDDTPHKISIIPEDPHMRSLPILPDEGHPESDKLREAERDLLKLLSEIKGHEHTPPPPSAYELPYVSRREPLYTEIDPEDYEAESDEDLTIPAPPPHPEFGKDIDRLKPTVPAKASEEYELKKALTKLDLLKEAYLEADDEDEVSDHADDEDYSEEWEDE